jgi:hypothetical protein
MNDPLTSSVLTDQVPTHLVNFHALDRFHAMTYVAGLGLRADIQSPVLVRLNGLSHAGPVWVEIDVTNGEFRVCPFEFVRV